VSQYIQLAREWAFKADKHPDKNNHCAIAFDEKDNILAVAYNSYTKSHPLQAMYARQANMPCKIYLHAEIGALIKAKAPVHRLVVVRIGRDGHLRPSAPCPVCALAIETADVKIVEHS
jgi:hypothetical protein